MMHESPESTPTRPEDFRTTHWSVVLLAGRDQSPEAHGALEKLCRAYWYPLYVFVRRQRYEASEAQDLTQEFFATLLEKNTLQHADPRRGRFRTFLLSSLKNFLANDWDKKRALKRGGGQPIFSLDDVDVEARYQLEPAHDLTPEKMFERRWAETVFERVMRCLREEYASTGKAERFEALKPFLSAEGKPATYAQVGQVLGLTENAVRSALSRLRQRSRELFRHEIAQTVASPEEIEDEIRYLFAALGD
ncbi:MAG: sigma-70 family RNA polymerase sigma factor [Verrucomicrobiales bacterium]|nr:sigma-70 family RNA polymerase sigma factor [Verrucomicrobiales bacterium]